MTERGATLYVPPAYLKRKVEQFAIAVRDKVNSFYGHERLRLIGYKGLEDGTVLIGVLDSDVSDRALFIKYNHELDTVDNVVRRFITEEVPDITEQFSDIKENIRPEDR